MRTTGQQLTQIDIDDIVALYEMDVPKLRIAAKYNKHHSTIIYHLNKHYKAQGKILIKKNIPQRTNVPSEAGHTHFILPKVKSYADYAEEEQDRLMKKRETCEHTIFVKTTKCKDCGVVHTTTIHVA